MKAQDQLARLLRLVPYLSAHPGVEVSTVAKDFGTTEAGIIADLEILQFCGLPGGYWDDLFDVDLDAVRNEGRIEFHNADVLARPLRLRAEEAASLLAALRLVVDLAGSSEAATSALAKLEAAVGPAHEVVQVGVEATDPEHRKILTEAIAARRTVELTYRSPGRREDSVAVVEPVELRLVDGYPYLEGYSLLRDGWRTYRLDRITEVVALDEFFPPHTQPRPQWFADAQELTVTVTAKGAWIAEYYPTTSVERLSRVRVRVTFPVASVDWAAGLLLRLGPAVVDVSDPQVRDVARSRAREALAAYRALPG